MLELIQKSSSTSAVSTLMFTSRNDWSHYHCLFYVFFVQWLYMLIWKVNSSINIFIFDLVDSLKKIRIRFITIIMWHDYTFFFLIYLWYEPDFFSFSIRCEIQNQLGILTNLLFPSKIIHLVLVVKKKSTFP